MDDEKIFKDTENKKEEEPNHSENNENIDKEINIIKSEDSSKINPEEKNSDKKKRK